MGENFDKKWLQGLKTAIVEGDVVGGTCVNRGCVPSKALLAVSGRMRELKSDHHLKSLGLHVRMLQYKAILSLLLWLELRLYELTYFSLSTDISTCVTVLKKIIK